MHLASVHLAAIDVKLDVEEGLWQEVSVMETEDTLVAMIQFETGCTLILKDCYAANMPDSRLLRIYGTKSGAMLHPLVIYGESEDGIQIDTAPYSCVTTI